MHSEYDGVKIYCPCCNEEVTIKFGIARCECCNWFAADVELDEIMNED